jgi:hypothetical protein
MISNADSDSDTDSDPDNSWRLTAKSGITYSSPERQSLSASHGPRPWVYLALKEALSKPSQPKWRSCGQPVVIIPQEMPVTVSRIRRVSRSSIART